MRKNVFPKTLARRGKISYMSDHDTRDKRPPKADQRDGAPSRQPVRGARSARAAVFACAILLIGAAALAILARKVPGFGDFYASNIYPVWQGSLGRIAGIIPFSLSEAILYALPVLLIIDIIVNRKRLLRVVKHLAVLASALAVLYSANCGVNYYRTSFSRTEGLDRVEPSSELLIGFCEYTAEKLIGEGGAEADLTDLGERAVGAMSSLGDRYPTLSGFYPEPKPILNSEPFSSMGVTGIYSPFTIEANYNRDITPYNLPFTACHELSHLKGYMNEKEANYIGWLACISSDDSYFNHSGWMMAWVYAGNALAAEDRDAFLVLRSSLPDSVISELEENNAFWREHETKASEVQDKVNDAYLKANGQENGVVDYGLVVDLMLSWYSSEILH